LIILIYCFFSFIYYSMAISPAKQSLMEGTWISPSISGQDDLCCIPDRVTIFPWNDTYSNISLQFMPNNSNCLSLYGQSDFVVGGVSWVQKQRAWLTNIEDKQTFILTAQNETRLSFNPQSPDSQTCPFVMQRQITSFEETVDDMVGYWSEVTVRYAESDRCCYPDYFRPINNTYMEYNFSSNSSLCDPTVFRTGPLGFPSVFEKTHPIYEFDTGQTTIEQWNVRLSYFSQESSLLLINHTFRNFEMRKYEQCLYYLSKKTETVPNLNTSFINTTNSSNPSSNTSEIRPPVSNMTNSTTIILFSQATNLHIKVIVLACLLPCAILIVLTTIIILNRKARRNDKRGGQKQNIVEKTVDYVHIIS